MAKGRLKSHPSIRNLEVYLHLIKQDCTQAQIAETFNISQPRVASIARQVAGWVDDSVPQKLLSDKPSLNLIEKFHLALAIRRCWHARAYDKVFQAFGGLGILLDLAPCLALWDAGTLAQEVIDLLPPRPIIEHAIRAACEADQLARLAQDGPYFELTAQFLKNQFAKAQPAASASQAVAAST